MRLHCFSTGSIFVPFESIHLNKFRPELLEIPIPWFVVDHPDALVIVDGGNPLAVANDHVQHWGEAIQGCEVIMDPAEACIPTLNVAGFDLSRPTVLVQTHLHSDHVGALAASDQLNISRVVVARREYDYAIAPDWHLAAEYIQSDFDKADLPWDLVSDSADGYDVLGDGTLLMHHTPGHTPGHMSIELALPQTGTVLLTGDAAYTQSHWNRESLPGYVASTVDAVRSVEKLRKRAEFRSARVFFGHDIEQWRSMEMNGKSYA